MESLEGRELQATGVVAPSPITPPPPAVLPPPPTTPAAPTVAFAQLEPLTGRVQVTISGDASGINPAELTNPANYSLAPVALKHGVPAIDPSRPNAGVILAPNFVVTGVSLTPPIQPGMPESLIVTIDNNQPLREGFYLFTIHGAGIVDNAGQALDGAYSGAFPSGNGQPGSDFMALLAIVNNTVQPALPVSAPSPPTVGKVPPSPIFFPTTNQVHVKLVGNDNRKSRLFGGPNEKVRALPNQFFPGTYHLPGTVGSSTGPTLAAASAKHAKPAKR